MNTPLGPDNTDSQALVQYLEAQRQLVEIILERDTCVSDLAFNPDRTAKGLLDTLAKTSHTLYRTGDLERTGQIGILATGLFSALPGLQREAAVLAALELEDEVRSTHLRRSCEQYSQDQPLFSQAPALWPLVGYKEELIHIDQPTTTLDASGQLITCGAMQARLHHLLNPALTRWLQQHAGVPLHLRVNPYELGSELEPNLFEAVIRPADPTWWQHLTIWPGERKPSRYEVDDCRPADDPTRYWEYHVRKMGRLDVSFRRDHSGPQTLSGCLEELPRPHGQHLIGYFLHVTSDDPIDAEWDAATATHIDGAVNVYLTSEDDKPRQRWEAEASGTMQVKASYRTHLFRINNVPLRMLIPIATRFFRSRLLVEEWLQDQFST